MRSNSVQFRGKKQVIQAYERNDMPAWSIWATPKDMLFAYDGISIKEGSDLLAQCLDQLKAGGSEAAYNLKVYEDHKKGAKILSNTPYSRSFNFGLFNPEGDDTPYEARNKGIMGQIDERFQKLQDAFMGKILDRLDKDDKEDREDEKSGIAGVLHGFLDVPGVKEALAGKFMNLLGLAPRPMPAQVNGVSAPPVSADQVQGPVISPEQYKKLEDAVKILAAADPLIGDHLYALALIARDQPKKCQMALSFL